MPRCIDADALISDSRICGNCKDYELCDGNIAFCPNASARRAINNAPTVETETTDVQEVKHGRWILDKEGTELVCSVCGGFAPLNYFKYHRVRSKYCPDCGARIDCKKEE